MTVRRLLVLHTGVLFWAVLGLSSALVCPDGGMCEDQNTCCRNTEGGYGCCPLPHAECCSDHLHCCHQGTLCDLVHQKCVNKTVSLPWMTRVPSKPALLVPQAVVCPDQESECPDDTTCCQLLDGSWGCCPLAKAVCCQDKLHCCPEGTSCDLQHSRCVSSSLDSAPLLHMLPARQRDASPAPPAALVLCAHGSTCCPLASGDSGCCPFPQATCCSDQIHCCPGNMRCDLEHGVCWSRGNRVPLVRKVPTAPGDVECPDQKSTCPDQTTCCQMTNDSYGCCPMPNALCCSDGVHCCPAGTQCDPQRSTCEGIEPVTPSPVPLAAQPPTPQRTGRSVPCNDSVSCADGNTCCRSVEEEWACCPLPKAVCCDDHLHCCPHATVCNLTTSTCDDPSGGAATPWLTKSTPTLNSRCDKSTSCPGMASGDWACCPLPEAVCCDDLVHCCPRGTVCNTEAQTCDDLSASSPSVPWQSKMAAVSTRKPQEEKVDRHTASGPLKVRPLKVPPLVGGDENMCDGQTSCPRDATCCFMPATQRWGCCPLPDAVCCSDGNHCCPSGHTCDPHQRSCSRGVHAVPWLSKLIPRTDSVTVGDVKCDDKSSCAAGATCCKLASGGWGCCPLVKAVCCPDHEHCCPQGYTCNMESGTCEKTFSTPTQTAMDVPCDRMGGFHCSTSTDLL